MHRMQVDIYCGQILYMFTVQLSNELYVRDKYSEIMYEKRSVIEDVDLNIRCT